MRDFNLRAIETPSVKLMTSISKFSPEVIPRNHLYNVLFSYTCVAVPFHAPIYHAPRSGRCARWGESQARRPNRVKVLQISVATDERGILGEAFERTKSFGFTVRGVDNDWTALFFSSSALR